MIENFVYASKTCGKLTFSIREDHTLAVAVSAAGGDFIAYMYGHVHNSQADTVDQNGRLHMIFQHGGANGEVVFIDTNERTIRTVGLNKLNREALPTENSHGMAFDTRGLTFFNQPFLFVKP